MVLPRRDAHQQRGPSTRRNSPVAKPVTNKQLLNIGTRSLKRRQSGQLYQQGLLPHKTPPRQQAYSYLPLIWHTSARHQNSSRQSFCFRRSVRLPSACLPDKASPGALQAWTIAPLTRATPTPHSDVQRSSRSLSSLLYSMSYLLGRIGTPAACHALLNSKRTPYRNSLCSRVTLQHHAHPRYPRQPAMTVARTKTIAKHTLQRHRTTF